MSKQTKKDAIKFFVTGWWQLSFFVTGCWWFMLFDIFFNFDCTEKINAFEGLIEVLIKHFTAKQRTNCYFIDKKKDWTISLQYYLEF